MKRRLGWISAAFSYGVPEEFRETEITVGGKKPSLRFHETATSGCQSLALLGGMARHKVPLSRKINLQKRNVHLNLRLTSWETMT